MALRITVTTAVVMLAAAQALSVNIETVFVGNPGNADDTGGDSLGGVDYPYRIGTFEVTASQYCEFLNAVADTDTYGLHSYSMWLSGYGCKIQQSGSPNSYTYSVAANWADRPVNYVSWGDAARFCNWLQNGQPVGGQDLTTTEDGAYYLNGAITNEDLSAVTRKPDAVWVIPTEDEWYKAAYHKNDGVTGNYFDYPTGSDSTPSNDLVDPDPGNNATFHDGGYTIGSPYYRTEVGAHENSESPYDTFDQGGNVWEWNEAVMFWYRGMRGGSFLNDSYGIEAAGRFHDPNSGDSNLGLRVVYLGRILTIVVEPNGWGDVNVDPLLPLYEPNATVTLCAKPNACRSFSHWIICDPNDPGDANVPPATIDPNICITIVMDNHRQVTAVFAWPNYALTIHKVNPLWGSVHPVPFEPNYVYAACTEVTLNAQPVPGRGFSHWTLYDPNHCGDVNYAVFDTNNPITVVMDSDKCVTAVFKCGTSIEPLLPIILGALGLFVWVRRRA